MYESDLFYWYLDEGGMLGHPRQTMEVLPLPLSDEYDEHNISNYFFGHMPRDSINRYVKLFNHTFPQTPIKLEESARV